MENLKTERLKENELFLFEYFLYTRNKQLISTILFYYYDYYSIEIVFSLLSSIVYNKILNFM